MLRVAVANTASFQKDGFTASGTFPSMSSLVPRPRGGFSWLVAVSCEHPGTMDAATHWDAAPSAGRGVMCQLSCTAVHANTQARNAGADAYTALPEVQADALSMNRVVIKSPSVRSVRLLTSDSSNCAPSRDSCAVTRRYRKSAAITT
jgi:hypothetical protein